MMKLYLDDDSVAVVLVALLQRGGHDVQIPADAGIDGEDDPVHLSHAVLPTGAKSVAMIGSRF